MHRIIPVAIIVVGLAVLASGAWSVLSENAPRVADTAGEVRVATSTIAEETLDYKIAVDYPQFGIPAIDAQIKQDIDGVVQEIKNAAPMPSDSAVLENSLEGSFARVYIDPDIISVELVLSQYTGGAHGNTLFSGVNFDRATGRRLEQSDAFALIGKSVTEVSAESSTQLKQKLGENFIFPEGANTNPENFSSFVISKDAVTFIFQPYQVTAYAYGPQEVRFERVK